MKYCPNCGKEIEENAKFCVYCGTRLDDAQNNITREKENDQHFDWDDEPTKPYIDASANNDQWDDSTSKWDEEEEPAVPQKKPVSVATLEKVKIFLLVVLIILVAAGGGFFYNTMSHQTSNKVTSSESSDSTSKSDTSKAKTGESVTHSTEDNQNSSSDSSTSNSSSSNGSTSDSSSSDSSSTENNQTTQRSEPTYKTSTTSTGVTYVNKAVKNEAGGYYGHDDTSNAPTYESDNDVLPDSSRDKVTDSDLQDLSNSQIQTAINELYARHGYKFSENTTFQNKSYYTGDKTETEAEESMNSTEKYNVDYLADYKAHNK